GADIAVAQSEVDDVRNQIGAARGALTTAQHDLRRTLGVVHGGFDLQGTLEVPLPAPEPSELLHEAQERRADLHARRAAVQEAESRLQLAVANRFGNPTTGPAFTYDNRRIAGAGVHINVPLPTCNT